MSTVIKNKEEYNAFLIVIECLINLDPILDSPGGKCLDLIADIVIEYEEKMWPGLSTKKSNL